MRIEFIELFDIPSATAQQRGHGAHGRTWQSPGLKAARAAWQALFEKHKPEKPLEGPIEIQAVLFYHRKGGPLSVTPRISRPDLDNLAKVFNDALMAAGVIQDDAAIWHSNTVKLEHGGLSMVHFIIKDLEDSNKEEKQ